MSAPEVVSLDRTEVAVPEVEGRAVLGVVRDVGRQGRVPPGVPGERANRRPRRRVQQRQEWSPAMKRTWE